MMASREERIANLASTLKSSGLAKSEVQARMMAEEMIGVEESVQKRYDQEHDKAQEFLRTAKNLGDPRIRAAPTQPTQTVQPIHSPQPEQQSSSRKIEPLKSPYSSYNTQSSEPSLSSNVETSVPQKVVLPEVYTDVNIGSGNLKDLMLNQIKEDSHEVKNIEELKNVDEKTIVQSTLEPVAKESLVESAIPEHTVDETFDDAPKQGVIDGEKLRQLMEEDGPLEEHTREIKEKPKNVKPKEEYAENNIDLSSMFNVHKS